MTQSLTLAGKPRAGRNSKPHHYKQILQKMNISKKWVLRGKQYEDFRQKKNKNIILDLSETPVGHQDLGAIN